MQEKTIGEKIREYRQKQGMTQDALAAELHVSSQAVSKWENGTGYPDIFDDLGDGTFYEQR